MNHKIDINLFPLSIYKMSWALFPLHCQSLFCDSRRYVNRVIIVENNIRMSHNRTIAMGQVLPVDIANDGYYKKMRQGVCSRRLDYDNVASDTHVSSKYN